jgi:hypothetical protein
MNKQNDNFFRDHADTLAIIGVNLAIAGFILSIAFMNMSNISATNARLDTLYVMFYDLLKEGKK